MINFTGHRRKERYIYRRVSWPTFQEQEDYGFITDGSVEYSAELDLKLQGKFTFVGYALPKVDDLLRVYYSFEDEKRELYTEPVATLLVTYAKLTHEDTRKGIKSGGSLNGSSVLKILKDRKIGLPWTISKNANPVYEAARIIKACGLPVEAEDSSYVMGKSYTFNAGTDELTIVNQLLEFAGFTPAFPDAMGVVHLLSYSSSQERTDYYVFRNDDNSIVYPEVEEQNDWQNTPNVVQLLYNVPDGCIAAEARNLTGSRASLDARGGREVVHFEEVSDIGGSGDRANNMRNLAEKKLRELSSDVEYVTFSHAYVPLIIYHPVILAFGENEWSGNVDVMKINLATSTKTDTRLKRVRTQEIEVYAEAEVIRQ